MLDANTSNTPDPRICEQARLTRDARFDGLFFTAVRSTGIYCRPICPAPTAKSHNVEYFGNAAAAASAGYRPCLRCRPEAAPGTPLTRARSDLVAAALRLIDAGALDDGSVAKLSRRIGVGERHLRRLFVAELGTGPLEIAATRRLLFAKKLLTETALPITHVAHAAGYGSLRRFNAAFLTGYGRAPRALRRGQAVAPKNTLTLRLPYRAPYDFAALLAFFARRAIPGIEEVDALSYTRRFALGDAVGTLRVMEMPNESALALHVDVADTAQLQTICTRCGMFDLMQVSPPPSCALWPRRSCAAMRQRRAVGMVFRIAVRAVLGQRSDRQAFAVRMVSVSGCRRTRGDG